jgi:hypothetical protein
VGVDAVLGEGSVGERREEEQEVMMWGKERGREANE